MCKGVRGRSVCMCDQNVMQSNAEFFLASTSISACG